MESSDDSPKKKPIMNKTCSTEEDFDETQVVKKFIKVALDSNSGQNKGRIHQVITDNAVSTERKDMNLK